MEPAWVAAGAAVAAAVAAWVAAINGSRTLRRARQDSQQRSRPVLAAELQPDEYSKGVQYLVLTNYGPGVAVDVRVTFDPPVPDDPTALDGSRAVLPFMAKRYAKPIPTFTPGMVLSNVYYQGTAADGTGQLSNRERGADRFTVTLSYRSAVGDRYEDRFTLDTAVAYTGTRSESSKHPDRTRERIAKALEQIVHHQR